MCATRNLKRLQLSFDGVKSEIKPLKKPADMGRSATKGKDFQAERRLGEVEVMEQEGY